MSQTLNRDIDPEKADERSIAPQAQLAASGWVVVVTITVDTKTDAVFFAVAAQSADEAEKAILRYPGILPSDARSALRQLSSSEISHLKLKPGGTRPYDRRTGSPESS
ncbi:hypothetical protein [Bradyrhizobium diversitatis]|uniref:Uncharacterized protein n=1 Tax=Bradyrhizobium diversitatis TaxID=2755406 RepID=A0ABS0NUR9_9BRAD|nr:hypothetical protein [Bradyrhizobium diversitatis]MBH5384757.1 hypothetical protein [Bradyrhizobium diversitatis]